MASAFTYRDQFFYVSNNRFYALVDFALEVGNQTAASVDEQKFVDMLKEKTNIFYPGYDLSIEHEFPSIEERKFWARIFFDVSYLIFHRKLGNQEISYWQHSASGDAYMLARMVTKSVQEEELAWHPTTLSNIDAETFHKSGLNVKF